MREIKPSRRMPERLNFGRVSTTTMAHPMGQWKRWKKDPTGENPHGLRTVMGYCLPTWQRGLVWTRSQQVAFLESAWRGVDIGTYTYNQVQIGSRMDNLLIDGQQRLHAIECYLNNEFPVFGWKWSEVTYVDERHWSMTTIFRSYITNSEDEYYLRGYYDLMNFGGTPHAESERASKP